MSNEPPGAYRLDHDFSHLGDTSADAHLVEFPHSDRGFWLSPKKVSLPQPLYFEAHLAALRRSDYPIVSPSVPVMSKRMVEVLASVGPLPAHQLLPVVMLDDMVEPHFNESGELRPGVSDDRFVCVHLNDFLDAFDWERSEYQPDKRLAGQVLFIQNLVLKAPPGGFPPLFRLSAASTSLFVSAAARAALEGAGMQGCEYLRPSSVSF